MRASTCTLSQPSLQLTPSGTSPGSAASAPARANGSSEGSPVSSVPPPKRRQAPSATTASATPSTARRARAMPNRLPAAPRLEAAPPSVLPVAAGAVFASTPRAGLPGAAPGSSLASRVAPGSASSPPARSISNVPAVFSSSSATDETGTVAASSSGEVGSRCAETNSAVAIAALSSCSPRGPPVLARRADRGVPVFGRSFTAALNAPAMDRASAKRLSTS